MRHVWILDKAACIPLCTDEGRVSHMFSHIVWWKNIEVYHRHVYVCMKPSHWHNG